MKKILIFIVLAIGFLQTARAQDWDRSGSCHVNANDPDPIYARTFRRPVVEATFKIIYPSGRICTGTLINRNTSDGDLGFYFLTARHCTDGMNFGSDHTLIFNYQSPDGASSSTPPNNRSLSDLQSGDADMPYFDVNGYEYRHTSRVELIAEYFWGDLSLCRIVTPIPPHFDVTYAGWNPNRFYNGGNPTADGSLQRFIGVHHPRGDIKKISTTPAIRWLENPIATGCYTITKVIDVLFGWIWRKRFSTSVICNYIDNPYINIPVWNHGITQPGSSGSGLFNSTNRLIGVLSFGASSCDFHALDQYGKLHANFSNAKVRNTLNPNHDYWVEWFGMDSRKIFCYDNLSLPGVNSRSGNYFPAKDYGPGNVVTLQARQTITAASDKDLHIFPEADYTFKAGKAVILGPGFDARSGALFVAEIGGCASAKEPDNQTALANMLAEIEVPRRKEFDMGQYLKGTVLQSDNLYANIYPNPAMENFTIKFNKEGTYKIELFTMVGVPVLQSTLKSGTEIRITLPQGLARGQYLVKMSDATHVISGVVVVQ